MHSTTGGDPLWAWGRNFFDGGGGPTHDATAGPTNSYESRLGSRYSWVSTSEATSPTGVRAANIHDAYGSDLPPLRTGSPPNSHSRYSKAAISDLYPSGRETAPRLPSDLIHRGPQVFESKSNVDERLVNGLGPEYTQSNARPDTPHTHSSTSYQTAAVMAAPSRWQSSTANDEVIAQALQEEFSHLASLEAQKEYPFLETSGDGSEEKNFLCQDWTDANPQSSKSKSERDDGPGIQNRRQEPQSENSYQPSAPLLAGRQSRSDYGALGDFGLVTSESGEQHHEAIGSQQESTSGGFDDDHTIALVLAEELEAQQEVAKRLHHMDSIPHVPKINGIIPTVDVASDDHQRLIERLYLYGLSENKIQGDGNCQFRALSDQLYRSPEHHKVVRKTVVEQLKSQPDIYEGYVPMKYSEYLKKMGNMHLFALTLAGVGSGVTMLHFKQPQIIMELK
eukprot:TRINITY_DN620_c0_g1_i3.p1 TRINITY_DN620_c0_g1~~TRINITY_DN620_c0_g1_i3.p1  ORF type:complete len:451 (-),score=46.33 TRINITY_DN620_c0_g1_i3:238-1590(-)